MISSVMIDRLTFRSNRRVLADRQSRLYNYNGFHGNVKQKVKFISGCPFDEENALRCTHSSEDRVVLFVDFTRPLPAPLAQLNEAVLGQIRTSSLMNDAIVRWNAWEARHGNELDRLLAKLSD